MPKQRITIDSVMGGQASGWHLGQKGQFLRSISVDPEFTSTTIIKPGGNIMPMRYQKRSSSGLTGAPMWILGNGKDSNIYVYASNGVLLSYDFSFAETSIGTPTNGVGNGAVYYNDYIYMATPTDISRYGRLSGTPSLSNTYWTSTLSMTALTNTTYPSTRNINYPNHVLFVHPSDNRLYIADYKNGQGQIHYITTAYDGSAGAGVYQALMLPYGMMPTAMGVSGTDLAILCIPEAKWTGSDLKPGNAALFIWDRSSPSFYRQVPIKFPLATAMVNKNGELYYWAGNIDTGCTLYKYLGGYSSQALADFTLGSPPFAGAVDALGEQIVWGAWESSPSSVAGVYAYGSRSADLPSNSLNHIARISDTGNTFPVVSALRSTIPGRVGNSLVIGWRTDTSAAYGLDTQGGSGAFNSVFSTLVYNVGETFRIRRIQIPLGAAVASGTTITPTIYFDDYSKSQVLRVINNTNFPNSERYIDLTITESTEGQNNFLIEFAFTGTTQVPINLPIKVDIETNDDYL